MLISIVTYVADALNRLYLKWFRRLRGPAATQANLLLKSYTESIRRLSVNTVVCKEDCLDLAIVSRADWLRKAANIKNEYNMVMKG